MSCQHHHQQQHEEQQQQQQQQDQSSMMSSFLDNLLCACGGSPESQVLEETGLSSVGSLSYVPQTKQAAYYDTATNEHADDYYYHFSKDLQASSRLPPQKERLPSFHSTSNSSFSLYQSKPIEGTLSFMDMDDSIRDDKEEPSRSCMGLPQSGSFHSVNCFKYDVSERSAANGENVLPAISAADTYTTISMSLSYQEEEDVEEEDDEEDAVSTESIHYCFRTSNVTTPPMRRSVGTSGSSMKQQPPLLQHGTKIDIDAAAAAVAPHEAYGYLLRMMPQNYLQEEDQSERVGILYRSQPFSFEEDEYESESVVLEEELSSSSSLPPLMPELRSMMVGVSV
jgi:hypothetical protein